MKMCTRNSRIMANWALLAVVWVTVAGVGAEVSVEMSATERAAAIAARAAAVTCHAPDHGHGCGCVELSELAIMFEPGASRADVERTLDLMPDEQFGRFVLTSRWLATATEGPVDEGAPLTLTYSFVPDGTTIPGFNGEPTSPSNLYATLDASFPGGRAAWKAVFTDAFARWGALSNITYVEVADDGAAFGPESPGAAGARGDIRIAMHPIGAGPLAYNFYPAFGGDMVLDSDDLETFLNPAGDYRALRNVLMHEHGHGLGMAHVIPTSQTKLMEPFLSVAYDGPQEDDVRAIQHQYGDPHELNDGYGQETFIGGPLRDPAEHGELQLTRDNLALERAGSSDWYGFTAFAGVPIAARVEPVGTAYQQGPQDGTPTTVDARAARDLGLRLWRRISVGSDELSLLAQIDFNGPGEAEYLPPLPYTFAGYMLIEVYSTDGVDDVQRYELTVSNGEITAAQGTPDLVVTQGLTVIGESDFVFFDDTEIGETASLALVVRNDGDGPLVFDDPAVEIAGAAAGDFSAAALPGEIAGGGFAVLGLTFAPTAEGQRVAVLTLHSNDPDAGEFGFIIRGAGLPASVAELAVSQGGAPVPSDGVVDLGEMQMGEDATVEFELENIGNTALTVLGTSRFEGAAADACSIEAGVPVTLAAGATSALTVQVVPQDVGSRAAELVLFDTSGLAPYRIELVYEVLAAITDCNGNGVADETDIAGGFSDDCDGDSVPDECQPDSDGDGVIDTCDACDGLDDLLDSDGDGVADCLDGCPEDAFKTEPGVCGCGVDDIDSDGDGVFDCEEEFEPGDEEEFEGDDPGMFPGEDEAGREDEEFIPDDEDEGFAGDDFDDRDDEELTFEEEAILGSGLCGVGAMPAAMISMLCLGAGRRYAGR